MWPLVPSRARQMPLRRDTSACTPVNYADAFFPGDSHLEPNWDSKLINAPYTWFTLAQRSLSMNNSYPPRKSPQPNPSQPQYEEMSKGLIVGLVLLPIPIIFILLLGNYSPRNKLLWSIGTFLETVASVLLLLAPLYYLRDAVAYL